MNLPASWRALGWLAGWAVPILAGLLCAPADARAECGDYVVTRRSHAEISLPAGQPTPAAPRPHKPCSGPHCSKAPAAPLAPAPTTPTPTSQEWGCILDGLGLASLVSNARLDEPHVPRPVRLAAGIFHPPRLAS